MIEFHFHLSQCMVGFLAVSYLKIITKSMLIELVRTSTIVHDGYKGIVALSVKILRKDNSEIVNKNILITIFLYFTYNHYSNGGILFPHFLSFPLSSTTSLINYLSFLLFLFCILPPITLHNLFFFYFPLWSQFLSSYSSLPVLNRADKLPGPFLANEGKSKS